MNSLLLYTLLGFDILILVPLTVMMNFLLDHWNKEGIVGELRKVLFWLAFSKFIFICGWMMLDVFAILHSKLSGIWLLITYIIITGSLATANWWALYRLWKIQKSGTIKK